MAELTNPKVHRYRSREQDLQRVILAMWVELRKPAREQNPDALDAGIRQAGLAWTLPSMAHIDAGELLTVAQAAELTGYAESTIRDWPARYGLTQHGGRYRWGDIDQLLKTRRLNACLTDRDVVCDTAGV